MTGAFFSFGKRVPLRATSARVECASLLKRWVMHQRRLTRTENAMPTTSDPTTPDTIVLIHGL